MILQKISKAKVDGQCAVPYKLSRDFSAPLLNYDTSEYSMLTPLNILNIAS